ncbi:MAG: LysR family transcriptional regulator [Hydrogenophaga sp.]|uniref:LysR family transcriptional regulator n=1 Tax=Hydrogenophaga sp. TaxID=1904254 RepID=UPI001E13F4F3|nr:LysR family transcriptional regulator [Hydrogenophaga sp.]MBX3609619.1 LysR family transcriptional regulator [Hydrogenophaga sp.]
MNTLDAMNAFARVAELGSFTQAAASLGLPKASVSTAVQQLEAQLGTRLLHRTTRRVSLTQDGQVFHDRCRDLLDDMDELRTLFQPASGGLNGRLRVDMPIGVARDHVLPKLPAFLTAHPGLSVELSSTDRRVDLVREGFDCVLRVGALGDSSLVARPLGACALVNCASADYVAQHGQPRTPDELATHRLVHYVTELGARSPGFEYQADDGQNRFVPMPGALTVNNSEAYRSACLAGLGIVQVPRVGVADLLREGRLVEVLPDWRPAPMPVTLLYAHRRNLPRRVQVFMQWLGEAVAPLVAQSAKA